MLRRLFLIGLLTGSGQLFAILVLKEASRKSSPYLLTQLAQIDSLFYFILNVIALGLQTSAIRNLAVANEWHTEYGQTQSARLMMGLLLVPLGLLIFNNPVYGFFLIAPLLALSGDYALYALGYPVTGSFISFVRAFIPYGLILLTIWINPPWIAYSFCAGLVIAYVITNLYIARHLRIAFFFRPAWKNLLLYVKSLHLGLVNLSLYFIGIGLLLIVPYFYPASIVTVAFVGLKFYLVFKGVVRIIHQAFVKDMTRNEVCLRVDQLSIIGGLSFFGSVVIFPNSFIRLFFGEIYLEHRIYFQLLGLSALVYSFLLSMATRVMLEKKDKEYTRISVIAASASILGVILFSLFTKKAEVISVSILLGEIVFLIGLLLIIENKDVIQKRVLFLLQSSALFIIPIIVRYLFMDSVYLYFIGVGSFTILLLFLHRNKFSSLNLS